MLPLPLLLFFAAAGLSVPLDDPVRIDLPVYNNPQSSLNVQLDQSREQENHPEMENKKVNPLVDNLFSSKFEVTSSLLDNKLEPSNTPIASAVVGGLFSAPVTTLEGAILESEGLGSKALSVKENIQHVAAGIFQPKPIVDTIKEEEKYGNSGDKFYSAGRAIVGGAERVSNLVNSVLEIPGLFIRKITRAATEKLNNLGGKLIGL